MEPRRIRIDVATPSKIPVTPPKRVMLVDGNCLSYQALYAMGPMQHRGEPTGVIFGVLTKLLRLVGELEFSNIVFLWDSPESKRKKKFAWYKAGRRQSATPYELKLIEQGLPQFNTLRDEILPDIGIPNQFTQVGYEADDLMARFAIEGTPCVLVTSDEDLWQCVRGTSFWYSPNGVRVGTVELREKGLTHPSDWAMVKAIAGCTSDNVPGIPGVGVTRAIQFLYNNLPDTDHGKKLDTLIRANWTEIIDRNLELVRLPYLGTNLVHPKPLDPSAPAWREVCSRYGLDSLYAQADQWVAGVRHGGGVFNSRLKPPTRSQRSRVASIIGDRLKKRANG